MTKDTQDFQTLVRRLDRVERQNKRLRRAVTTLTVLCLAVLVIGAVQPKSRSVEAEAFILVDENGKKRATLMTPSPGNLTSFSIYDMNEKERVSLIETSEGSGLYLYGQNGKEWLELDVSRKGPMLRFQDNKSEYPRISLSRLGLILNGFEVGEGVIMLTLQEGGGGLMLSDTSSLRISLLMGTEPPSFVIYGADKKILYSIP